MSETPTGELLEEIGRIEKVCQKDHIRVAQLVDARDEGVWIAIRKGPPLNVASTHILFPETCGEHLGSEWLALSAGEQVQLASGHRRVRAQRFHSGTVLDGARPRNAARVQRLTGAHTAEEGQGKLRGTLLLGTTGVAVTQRLVLSM